MRLSHGLIAVATLLTIGVCYADYSVRDEGTWPSTWPKELEVLRNKARTFVGPMVENQHFAIRFESREQFEKLWPHLLSVKTKGAPVILVKGPSFFLGEEVKAGVVVHAPPAGQVKAPRPDVKLYERSIHTTYIELVVDGDIVDLNRINLSSVVVDERFKESK